MALGRRGFGESAALRVELSDPALVDDLVELEAAKGVLDGDQVGAWLKWCCLDDAKDGSRVSQDELERLIPAFERVFERPGELVGRRPFLAFVLGVEGAQAAGEPADAAPG